MKNIYLKIITVIAIFSLVISCDENVDNIQELTGKDSFELTITDDESLANVLNGMYDYFNSQTAFGQYIPVIGELLSDDAFVSVNNTNRFTTTDQYNWTESSGDYTSVWEQLYDAVAQANVVIEYKDIIEVEDQAYVNNIVGQAYVGRAMSFFYLAAYFAQNPNSNIESDKGIILPTVYDATTDLPRASVNETWSQIESDLLTGLSLLNDDSNPNKLGKTAANILLSRVYLFLADYNNALKYANAALNSSSYQLVGKDNYVASWVDEASKEAVFQLNYTAGDNLTLSSLASIYDDLGYGDVMFRESLYNLFPDGDVRKELLTMSNRTADNPIGYWTLKFPYDSGVGGVGELDVRLLRMSEAWLNKIEALYHINESQALTELNNFAATRHSSTYSSSGTALLDDILNERKMEFFSEGHRFFDLKRNERDIEEVTNCINICTVTYPNNLFVFPIPNSEIQSNTALSDADQNPGY